MHVEVVRDGRRIFLSGPKGWYRVELVLEQEQEALMQAYTALVARKPGFKRARRNAAKAKRQAAS
jgi:hypothetical protein